MSKILKIERQPWMPKWAHYWCINTDRHKEVSTNCYLCKNPQGAGVEGYDSIDEIHKYWDYVYEITDYQLLKIYQSIGADYTEGKKNG